ncbi:MAG: FAD-binding oxidoreductase [Pseudomonadota bacterium]
MTNNTDSWGRLDQKPRASLPGAQWVTAASRERASPVLPFGNGRSYGDSCHCDTGHLLLPNPSPHSIHLNQETGLLRADAGVLLKDVLEVSAGTGWFPPVLPGTKYVTLGGAVANDIHGKNHARLGTFGRHVLGFSLTRSDRKAVWCSKAENAALFGATIGGMGLTGLIGEIELQMMAALSHAITTRNQPFETLEEFFTLVDEAEAANEYCVAWVDSLASNKRFGRGIIISGNHAAQDDQSAVSAKTRRLSVPFTPPVPLVAGQALKTFNELYFRSNAAKRTTRIVSANSFFFPLDAIGHWNRLYGPKGLFH